MQYKIYGSKTNKEQEQKTKNQVTTKPQMITPIFWQVCYAQGKALHCLQSMKTVGYYYYLAEGSTTVIAKKKTGDHTSDANSAIS